MGIRSVSIISVNAEPLSIPPPAPRPGAPAPGAPAPETPEKRGDVPLPSPVLLEFQRRSREFQERQRRRSRHEPEGGDDCQRPDGEEISRKGWKVPDRKPLNDEGSASETEAGNGNGLAQEAGEVQNCLPGPGGGTGE